MIPKIKKTISEVETSINNINISGMTSNIEQALGTATTAMQNFKSSIDNIINTPELQEWLNSCSDALVKISEIDWNQLIDALSRLEDKGLSTDSIINILSIVATILAIDIEKSVIAQILEFISAITISGEALSIVVAVFFKVIAVIAILAAAIALIIVIWNLLSEAVSNFVAVASIYLGDFFSKVSIIFQGIWEVISTIFGYIWDRISIVFNAIWGIISPILNAMWTLVSTIFQAIWTIISTILGSVWNIFSQVFNWIWQVVSVVFNAIWNIIYPIITKIWTQIKEKLELIKAVWSYIWNGIKDTVLGIWNVIWNGIKSVVNAILFGIESFINGTIKGINKLLKGISDAANAVGDILGIDPINLQISTVTLPRLAKGAVLRVPTIAEMAEYPGARTNPEIVTPQNIMYDTMLRALASSNNALNNSEKPVRVQIYWGTKNVVDEIIDGINEKTRRTGRTQIKVAYE